MSEWKPIETAADFERVLVCGWQQASRGTKGYWWWHEDCAFEGVACEHPDATHWCPIVLPPFPEGRQK